MIAPRKANSDHAPAPAVFQSTLWSQVHRARSPDTPSAMHALEQLCRRYWPPIFAFLKRSGHDDENAKDLTQGFFAHLLQGNLLRKADPGRGRFRSFLLGALRFYVANESARARALKRGGGFNLVSIDAAGDDGATVEPATRETPEQLFDRKWALQVLDEAMQRLATEYRRAGLHAQFLLLRPHLTGESEDALSDLAVRLGKSAGATRVLVCRLRNRFRRQIRAVLADTVTDLDQVESELQHLENALRDD